jgi:PTH2 family peptidyl-tRNA hydrolase
VEDSTLRQFALVRGDLSMSPGKLAAQAGHAFLDAFLVTLETDPARAAAYRASAPGTKVVLAAPTLAELEYAYALAQRAGLPCALIVDEGHILPPHFDGPPLVTALGLGPVRRREVRHITDRFALVP